MADAVSRASSRARINGTRSWYGRGLFTRMGTPPPLMAIEKKCSSRPRISSTFRDLTRCARAVAGSRLLRTPCIQNADARIRLPDEMVYSHEAHLHAAVRTGGVMDRGVFVIGQIRTRIGGTHRASPLPAGARGVSQQPPPLGKASAGDVRIRILGKSGVCRIPHIPF
jgi:hypothetical protein